MKDTTHAKISLMKKCWERRLGYGKLKMDCSIHIYNLNILPGCQCLNVTKVMPGNNAN